MSSTNSKVSFKVRPPVSETRQLKPILPKPNTGVVTRVIEINSPTLPMCKCFVCDERVIASGVPLLQSTTQASNTDLPTKIGQLVGDKFMVVVSADDVLCRKCHALVNHVDKLESDLSLVKRSLINNLKKKYGLTDEQLKDPKAKEAEPECITIPDGDSDEEAEPQAKKPKSNREVKYRAIKPKPSNAVELFRCSNCNFITVQSELFACHRLVCGTLAYKCTMCDKKFESQKMVLNHKIEAHLTKWICHFCNLNFNEERKFTVHMKHHLGDKYVEKFEKKVEDAKKEKTLVLFQCPHCPESFEAFSQLQTHLVNHTCSVSFKCVRCDIGFDSKTTLMEHVKSHEAPVQSHQPTVQSQQLPVQSHQPPVQSQQLPVQSHQPPVQSQQITVQSQQLPVQSHQLPIQSQQITVQGQQLPVQSHQLPIQSQQITVQGQQITVQGQQLTVQSQQLPVQSHQLPIQSHQLAVQSQQLPVQSHEPLIQSHQITVQSQQLPVQSHESLVQSQIILHEAPKQVEVINDTIYSCPVCSLNFIQEDMYLQHLTVHPEFASPSETEQAINFLVEQNQENGLKSVGDIGCICGDDNCIRCGVKEKMDEKINELTQVTDLLVANNEVGNGKEAFMQENAGEEGSHLELNHLLFVNSLNLQLSEGNNPLQSSSEDKNGDASQTEIETNNSKSVEDILENMFQVKDEDVVKKGPGDKGMEESGQEINNLNDNKGKTFVCADCSFSTQNLLTLKQHFVDKHGLVKCSVCDNSFDLEELKNHMVTAHGTSFSSGHGRNYTCVHCSERFINRRALHMHEATHPENLRIECPDCGEKFAREKFLNEHRDETHVISHCRMCNKAFGNVKQLKSHEMRHARCEKNKFKCTDCARVFQTPTGLRHHKAIHTGDFKYKCEFCDKGFVSRVRCEEHRASHTKEERYSCDVCGKKFSFQATYWIHRKWHDNPTPYKCEYCGRLFKHSSLLSVHKRKHTGERPYECPHCDQSFAVGNTLKRHLMLHTGVFPFTCHLCDQGFSGKHKLAQHMSKIHQDNTFLGRRKQKQMPEYKMALKPDENSQIAVSDPFPNQTWIVAEDENVGSQLMALQAGGGDSMPCALLSDDMMGDMVDVNSRIEIIPYSMKSEDKLDDSSFIELQESAASLGLVGDVSQDFTSIEPKGDHAGDGVFGSETGLSLDPYENGRDGADDTNGSLSEHFVSQL